MDDRDFIRSAIEDAERLRSVGLRAESRVLDFGCGCGRLAFGLMHIGFEGSYLGLEVQARHTEWCSQNISSHIPAYEFELLDAKNERYNPGGSGVVGLPVDDESIDVFYAYSVFSHMRGYEVAHYLKEISRVLAPAGRAFLTVFCDSGVPDETENPSWWGPMVWRGALHCVLYSVEWLEQKVGLADLVFDDFRKSSDVDGQTALVLSRR